MRSSVFEILTVIVHELILEFHFHRSIFGRVDLWKQTLTKCDESYISDGCWYEIRGRDWNQPTRSCSSETQPFFGAKYPAGVPLAWVVVNKVLARIKKPVYLLDITFLSQMRKDAHPSKYSGDHSGTDCSHWCLPGLPDTWNDLLYAALFGWRKKI